MRSFQGRLQLEKDTQIHVISLLKFKLSLWIFLNPALRCLLSHTTQILLIWESIIQYQRPGNDIGRPSSELTWFMQQLLLILLKSVYLCAGANTIIIRSETPWSHEEGDLKRRDWKKEKKKGWNIEDREGSGLGLKVYQILWRWMKEPRRYPLHTCNYLICYL